jgi:hypothetical protein
MISKIIKECILAVFRLSCSEPEDSATVIPYLDKKYGETYSKAVASNQETFIASEFIPGIVLLNIIRQSNSIDENSSDNMVMVNMLYDFFDSVFEGEEQERFYNYCADPSNKIQIPDLFDIFTKMFESYTDGRPTNG